MSENPRNNPWTAFLLIAVFIGAAAILLVVTPFGQDLLAGMGFIDDPDPIRDLK